MFVEERTYTIAPGQIGPYVDTMAELGVPLTRRHGWRLYGYFRTETTTISQAVHYWLWDSLDARTTARAAFVADPDREAYVAANAGRVQAQRARLLVPTDFCPPLDPAPTFDDRAMVYDLRTYTVKPGEAPRYAAVFRDRALPVLTAHGARLIAYFTTELGALNQVVHLWRWTSLDERMRIFAALDEHPSWPAYRAENLPRLERQENQFMVPAGFSPLQ